MLFRNLCSTYCKSFQSTVLDQFSCKISFRTLKCTACTRILQWLLRYPLLTEVIHLRFYFFFFAFCKRNHGTQNDISFLRDNACTVSESQFFCRKLHDLALFCHNPDTRQYILHLSAIRTGVHHNRSAKRSRNTRCELKSGQCCIKCCICNLRKRTSCLRHDLISFYLKCSHTLIKLDDRSSEAFVSNQKVTSISYYIYRYRKFPAHPDCRCQFLFIRWHDKIICRTTDPEGCMLLHRFILLYFGCIDHIIQTCLKILFHSLLLVSINILCHSSFFI